MIDKSQNQYIINCQLSIIIHQLYTERGKRKVCQAQKILQTLTSKSLHRQAFSILIINDN